MAANGNPLLVKLSLSFNNFCIMALYALNNNPIVPSNLGSQKGVYIIYALGPDGTPQPINRVLDTDKRGVLYIGQTTKQTFKDRLEMFRRAINPAYAATAHSGGLNMKRIPALRNRFPSSCIYVEVIPSANPKSDEEIMIENYRQQFGEVPPLNGGR